ncbi:MAG: LacI family transcriptional regulator [Lachnospiraceae bacterium]
MGSPRNNSSKELTIYDIAAEAGVSASTVSRVLTNSARVNEDKKIRVQKIIDKYNFKPNTFAKGLIDAKSRTIGILMTDIRDPFYASMFIACEQAARKENYSVTLYNSLGDAALERSLLRKLQAQRVDAVILLGGREEELNTDMEYVEMINNALSTIPAIITGKLDGTDCHMVRIDHMQSMDLLMDHLLSLGHSRIAVLGGSMNMLSTFEKVARFKQILKQNRLLSEPDLISQNGMYDTDSGYTHMNRLFEKGLLPTAVIAVNDHTALGIMQSIREHGLKIPGDISVVSCGNTYLAESSYPKLTSIDYNDTEYGALLVRTAIRRIERQPVERLQLIAPALIIRESSGRAKKTLSEEP